MDGRIMAFLLLASFLLGIFVGEAVGTAGSIEKNRMFDRCLEWKKDFDLCRKEFMS